MQELVEYLRKACPDDFLKKHALKGGIKGVIKAKKVAELHGAYAEHLALLSPVPEPPEPPPVEPAGRSKRKSSRTVRSRTVDEARPERHVLPAQPKLSLECASRRLSHRIRFAWR